MERGLEVLSQFQWVTLQKRELYEGPGNIRMELKEIGINTINRVDSAMDKNYWRALVNAALNLRVP
jgi:hypothetical protein